MKKLLFGCIVTACCLTMPKVSAMDYCCPPQCDPCCYGADFNGFYIGGDIGVISHIAHRLDLDGFLTDNSGWTTIGTNFTAGLLLGYDWQCNNTVFGFVADWNWVNTNSRVNNDPNAVVDSFIDNDHHWFTTIRARAGLAFGEALVYVTGGAAVSYFETRWNDVADGFDNNNNRWGWAGGAGAEFLLGCNWSFGLEVLWTVFSHHEEEFDVGGTLFRVGHSDQNFLGRIILNYRFGDLFSCCR